MAAWVLWKSPCMTRPSIFESAGGEAGFLALATAHHERCLADPELEHPFSHGVQPDHVERLAAYWAEVFGGPPRYSVEYGGHSAMIGVHAGEGIGPEYSARFVRCFVQAADDAGLPEDLELRRALRAYMEWATADVEAYAARGSVVEPRLPMPHWSWDGLQAG
jgi:hemoglobin